MRRGSLLVAVAVLVVATVCVSLGLWQLSRYREKQRLNQQTRAALRAPPVDATRHLPPLPEVRGRRVRLIGRYDETRQFLLAGRTHDSSPGVEVVTPLRPEGGGPAVLVNRGWLYAGDAATALPQQYPEPGVHELVGLAQALAPAGRWGALRAVLRDSIELWSARTLDPDSVARQLPYPIAPYMVRALPAPGAPATPARSVPPELNEMMHLSYAVQWFLFAAIAVVGPLAFVWSRRRRRGPDPEAANPDLSFGPPSS